MHTAEYRANQVSIHAFAATIMLGLVLLPGPSHGQATRPSTQATTQPAAQPATIPAITKDMLLEQDRNRAIEARLRETKLDELVVDGMTLEKAIELFKSHVDVPVFVRWDTRESSLDKRDHLTIRYPKFASAASISGATALRMILASAVPVDIDLDYTVQDGIVIISTRAELRGVRYRQTRTYNLRDLIARTARPPMDSAGENESSDEEPFAPVAARDVQQLADRERINMLTNLITNTVDSPSWIDKGGEIGSMTVIGSQLVVVQAGYNHRAIDLLLLELTDPCCAEIRQKLAKRLAQVSLKQATLADALKYLKEQTGVNIVVDPVVRPAKTGTINIDAANLTAEQILGLVLRMARLEYMIADGAVYIVPQSE